MTTRPHDYDALADDFAQRFANTNARDGQIRTMSWLRSHDHSSFVIVEAPTGFGKSIFGLWHVERLLEGGVCARAIYVCHTVSLQTQLAKDCARWSVQGVDVLFGRDQYACPRRTRDELDRRDRNRRSRQEEEIAEFAAAPPPRDPIDAFLEDVALRSPRDAPDHFYEVPMRSLFMEHCRAHEVPDAEAADVWERVSCSSSALSPCDCKERESEPLRDSGYKDVNAVVFATTDCHHTFARLKCLLESRIVILNYSLLFTYIARGVSPSVLDGKPYVVLDEAHELSKSADPLLVNLLPRELDAARTSASVREWKELGFNVCDDIDPAVFANEHEREGRESTTKLCFESRAVAPHLRSTRIHASSGAFADVLRLLMRAKKTLDAIKAVLRALRSELRETQTEPSREAVRTRLRKALFPDDGNAGGLLRDDADVDRISLAACQISAMGSEGAINRRWGDDAVREAWELLRERIREQPDFDAATFESVLQLSRSEADVADIIKAAKTVLDVLSDVRNAKLASVKSQWTNDDVRRLIVPQSTSSGVTYTASISLRGQVIAKHLWNDRDLLKGALIMSATMQNHSLDPQRDKLSTFKIMTGLDLAERPLPFYAAPDVFDRRRVVICAPMHMCYNAHATSEQAAKLLDEQVSTIARAVQLNPGKSTLVIGPNVRELKATIEAMRVRLPHEDHIHYDDTGAFERFRDSDQRAIVYGCDRLSTGVDLPGRVGLVVILRPLNRRPNEDVSEYEKRVMRVNQEWEGYAFQRELRTAQSAGRLQRCFEDAGVVMMLCGRKNWRGLSDAHVLGARYGTMERVREREPIATDFVGNAA